MGKRRGGGRGGGGGGGGGEGGFEDQYGETMQSQERNDFRGPPRGGGAAGGSAGGSGRAEHNVSFQRHVPKFLQQYSHMLGRGAQAGQDEPVVVNRRGMPDEEGDDEEEENEDALRQAIQQDPSLLAKHPELAAVAAKSKAADLKAKGNAAFGAKDYEQAIQLFSQAIECDPKDAVFYSNRSAAHAALKQWREAEKDGKRATQLKPSWAKGWTRLGAAQLGSSDFSRAVESFQRASELEPDNAEVARLLQQARQAEHKAVAERKHTFKRKESETQLQQQQQHEQQKGKRPKGEGGGVVVKAPATRKAQLLSFDDD